MTDYRPNVAALLFTREGKLLICERSGKSDAWQFPQGGVHKGETELEALKREVLEEVGIKSKHYDILESRLGYKYDFPKERRAKKGYKGQKQTYFLCVMKPSFPDIDLGDSDAEFQDYQWIKPKSFKESWLPEWKRKVYTAVMSDFFNTTLK